LRYAHYAPQHAAKAFGVFRGVKPQVSFRHRRKTGDRIRRAKQKTNQ
jgi:hypothetical protein